MKRLTPFLLLAGDLLVLFLFVFIGQSDHETIDPTNPLGGVLLGTAEFALPWVLVGWLLNAFRIDPSRFTPFEFLARTLNAWLVAAPLALLLRALVLGRAVIPTAFFLVAVGLGGAFIIGWRLIFALVERRAPRSAP